MDQPYAENGESASDASRDRELQRCAAQEDSERDGEQQLRAVEEHDGGAEPTPHERQLDREHSEEPELRM